MVTGLPPTAASTTATAMKTACAPAAELCSRPRCSLNLVLSLPPASAPAAKAAMAASEAPIEKPGAPASAKPRKTMLPVILATKTWPSVR